MHFLFLLLLVFILFVVILVNRLDVLLNFPRIWIFDAVLEPELLAV